MTPLSLVVIVGARDKVAVGEGEVGKHAHADHGKAWAPFVYQQSTVVDPNVNYWLGSIAMDKTGNIALGFSASSQSVFPSVYVAGRAPSDPAGALFGPLVLVNGSGVQFNSYHRWGDYSAMTLDPVDDCTFWYTQEYYATTGSFNWSTRIGSFKFSTCKGRAK